MKRALDGGIRTLMAHRKNPRGRQAAAQALMPHPVADESSIHVCSDDADLKRISASGLQLECLAIIPPHIPRTRPKRHHLPYVKRHHVLL